MTDRAAAGYRHRDVFALAEEMYARVPRTHEPEPPPSPPGAGPSPSGLRRTVLTALTHLAPGLCCLAGTVVLRAAPGGGPVTVCVTAVTGLAAAVALGACLRTGPLRAEPARVPFPRPSGRTSGRTRWSARRWHWLWTAWLLAFLVAGGRAAGAMASWPPADGGAFAAVLEAVARWGRTPDPVVVTVLAFAAAPAAWCAARFARHCRARIGEAAGPRDFAMAVRPEAGRTGALFLGSLLVLLAAADLLTGRAVGPSVLAAALALGFLLFVARLLTVHGHGAAAGAGLAAACLLQAAVLGAAALSGLPGPTAPAGTWAGTAVHVLALPAGRPAVVQTLTCAVPALVLFVHGFAVFGRVSGHRPRPARAPSAPARRALT